ncbi:MAG: hypothetical protein ACK47B_03305 [Armatimonadota bacterium]
MPVDWDHLPLEHQDLLGVRTDTPYTEAERLYSASVQAALEELLQGRRHRIVLLRRHHAASGRAEQVEVLPAPAGVDRRGLRRPMVERILVSTIAFVRDISPGGPVFQREAGDHLLETQHFSTKYPHIIIERLDAFHRRHRTPEFTEWRLCRTQNQRAETQINRWLDAANLALSFVDTLRSTFRRRC